MTYGFIDVNIPVQMIKKPLSPEAGTVEKREWSAGGRAKDTLINQRYEGNGVWTPFF